MKDVEIYVNNSNFGTFMDWLEEFFWNSDLFSLNIIPSKAPESSPLTSGLDRGTRLVGGQMWNWGLGRPMSFYMWDSLGQMISCIQTFVSFG